MRGLSASWSLSRRAHAQELTSQLVTEGRRGERLRELVQVEALAKFQAAIADSTSSVAVRSVDL